MFICGEGDKVSTIQVAESIYNLCDTEGNGFIMFDETLYHRSNNKAISKEGGFIHKPKLEE